MKSLDMFREKSNFTKVVDGLLVVLMDGLSRRPLKKLVGRENEAVADSA